MLCTENWLLRVVRLTAVMPGIEKGPDSGERRRTNSFTKCQWSHGGRALGLCQLFWRGLADAEKYDTFPSVTWCLGTQFLENGCRKYEIVCKFVLRGKTGNVGLLLKAQTFKIISQFFHS